MFSSILAKLSGFVLGTINNVGYLGVFGLMVLESANIPIPSEIIMPFAGFLASGGTLNFWLIVFLGAIGNLSGSLFSYWLGYLVRKDILKWNNHKIFGETERAKIWLDRFGDWAVFISRIFFRTWT